MPRVILNIVFSLLSAAAGALAVRPAGLGMAVWAAGHHVGLLHAIHLPAPARFAAGFLLMDLTFYYWHRANHAMPLLWRFHNAHHIDPDLDVSTSFRFHFVEILYSALFRIAQVSLIGVSAPLYLTYELFFTLETMFHHSNVRLPLGFERLLNKIIVTPRMHGIHHSFYRNETNSNYSVIFSWWDRLHRSLRLNARQNEIQIGVPAYHEIPDNSLINLILMPFRVQRSYWESGGEIYGARADAENEKHRTTMRE